MTPDHFLWIASIGFLIAFLTGLASKSLAEISWHEMQEYCRRRKLPLRFDQIHDHADETLLSTETLQTISTISAVVASVQAASVWGWFDSPLRMAAVTLGLCVSFLVGPLWIPLEVARRWGTPFLAVTWPVWRLVNRLMRPLRFCYAAVRFVLRRLDGRAVEPSEEEALEEEIRSIVTEGQHDGLLEADVREMIEGVIELDDTDVADIMTPRSKMDAIQVDTEWRQMLEFVVEMGRTRIPVYDKNLDDIVGLLYAKDLLVELSRPDAMNRNLRSILREAGQVPRSTRLDEMLQQFLQTRIHLAIVVDEFMHVVGLVTIEDVLEEIVGEIVDESDKEEVGDIHLVSDTETEINGKAHIEEINERLGTSLPEGQEYDTLGGFLLSQLGRIPKSGESVEWKDLRLTVIHANKRRIERVRLETIRKPHAAEVS